MPRTKAHESPGQLTCLIVCRQAKGEEPVALCSLIDGMYEIELLEDGRSHLWGCVDLPLPQPGILVPPLPI